MFNAGAKKSHAKDVFQQTVRGGKRVNGLNQKGRLCRPFFVYLPNNRRLSRVMCSGLGQFDLSKGKRE